MECAFNFDYPKPKDEMVEKLRAAILSQSGGKFEGDTSSGEFSFKAKVFFKCAGTYKITGDNIAVEISKKPPVSCEFIEEEIRKYIASDNA